MGGISLKKCLIRKGLILGIILLFIGAGIIPSTVGIKKEKTQIQTIKSGGYIQSLIDNASDGDTIYIPSGIYYENIIINKSISLIGEDKNTTKIDGDSHRKNVITVTADWVNISGFTIRNSGIDGSGILLYGFCNFSHNIVTLNNGSGILIRGGLFGNYGYCNVISDNIITYNKCDGIILVRAEANTITNNTISNNGNGIYACGDLSGLTSDNIISGNNIISNNGYGIELYADCWNNIIFHNNFINNGENAVAYDWGDVWDNGYPSGGNFWDDYNGTDSDGDGIGDTPYTIDGNGEDRYPLGNFRPDIPMINGQTHGKPGVDYDYTFVTTDPEGDDVWYHICWGDKEIIYIYGPFPSGEDFIAKHTWAKKGKYIIKARAIDKYDKASDWTILEVTMPKIKPFNSNFNLLNWLFKQFPNVFPILKYILG